MTVSPNGLLVFCAFFDSDPTGDDKYLLSDALAESADAATTLWKVDFGEGASMRQIEFTADRLRYQSERLFVIGRCCEDTLVLGDTFSCVCEYEKAVSLEDYARPARRIEERPICLRVVSINAYGRELEFISPGMTAEIGLAGADLGLRVGQVIAGVGDEDREKDG